MAEEQLLRIDLRDLGVIPNQTAGFLAGLPWGQALAEPESISDVSTAGRRRTEVTIAVVQKKTVAPQLDIPIELVQGLTAQMSDEDLRQFSIEFVVTFNQAWNNDDPTIVWGMLKGWEKIMDRKKQTTPVPSDWPSDVRKAWEERQAKYAGKTAEEVDRELEPLLSEPISDPGEARYLYQGISDNHEGRPQ